MDAQLTRSSSDVKEIFKNSPAPGLRKSQPFTPTRGVCERQFKAPCLSPTNQRIRPSVTSRYEDDGLCSVGFNTDLPLETCSIIPDVKKSYEIDLESSKFSSLPRQIYFEKIGPNQSGIDENQEYSSSCPILRACFDPIHKCIIRPLISIVYRVGRVCYHLFKMVILLITCDCDVQEKVLHLVTTFCILVGFIYGTFYMARFTVDLSHYCGLSHNFSFFCFLLLLVLHVLLSSLQ